MTKAHGLRGDVIVRLTTDRTEERTAPGAVFFVDGRTLEVAAAKPYQKNWLVTFVGVDSREAADSLRGAVLQADELVGTDLVFAHQLIGKRLVDQNGTDHGPIESLIDNPASDLLELSDGRMVPMVFFQAIEGDIVLVDVPAGLLDDGAVEVRDA